MKTVISVSIDVEVLMKMREKGLSPSKVVNEALWRAVQDPQLVAVKEEKVKKEIDELTRIKTQFEEAKVKENSLAEAKLNEFFNLPKTVTENKEAMDYWSRILGRSVEELTLLYQAKTIKP